jgi:hypothetical protein
MPRPVNSPNTGCIAARTATPTAPQSRPVRSAWPGRPSWANASCLKNLSALKPFVLLRGLDQRDRLQRFLAEGVPERPIYPMAWSSSSKGGLGLSRTGA